MNNVKRKKNEHMHIIWFEENIPREAENNEYILVACMKNLITWNRLVLQHTYIHIYIYI